jgi:hypothetical protein
MSLYFWEALLSELIKRLDEVPGRFRIIPAVIALLIMYAIFEGKEIVVFIYLHKKVFLVLLTLSLFTIIAVSLRSRFNLKGIINNYMKEELENVNVYKGIYFRAFRLYSLSREKNVSEELSKIIRSRASRGLADYLILSNISRKGNETLLFIISDNSLSVDMESEIFLTLMSSLELVRVEEVNIDRGVLCKLYDELNKIRASKEGPIVALTEVNVLQEKEAKDFDIIIGETLDTPTPMRIGLQRSDIASHVAVFGSTGSGKSTTASILACETWSKLRVPVIIMDWSGEYNEILKKIGCKTKINLIDPTAQGPIVDPLKLGITDSDVVSEIIGKALGLSWPQVYMLGTLLDEKTPSSVEELARLIENLPEESKWDKEVKRGLLRRIGISTRGQGLEILSNSSYDPLEYEWKGINIFDLSRIRLSVLRRAYVLLFLSSLFVSRVEKNISNPEPMFIIVDEAHNVFDPGDIPFTDTLVAESRKLGLWLCIITQSPSNISNSVLLNTNTKIIHAIRSARDKVIIAETMNLRKDYIELLDKLSIGQALLAAPSLREPILIRLKLF